MKTTIKILTALILTTTFAHAASGASTEGIGIQTILFLTFGAIIVAFQFMPGLVLFSSMLKGIFGKVGKTGSAAE